MNQNQRFGKMGEDFAASLLELDGYSILERNFRCAFGEIDMIAEKDGELCFVEVKTRRTLRFGEPWEAVTREKQHKIRQSAALYLGSRKEHYRSYSFQVIEVGVNRIKNAF